MIRLAAANFDPYAELARFAADNSACGAIASFTGVVRGDEGVSSLFLEHFPGVTETEIAAAVASAREQFGFDAALIIHRTGETKAGEPVVLVAVAARHRRAAFEACDRLMDFLKTDAPFWKQERGEGGARWIEPRAADYADRDRWRPKP